MLLTLSPRPSSPACTSSSALSRRAASATCTHSGASARATAAPMPLEAPVTTATHLSKDSEFMIYSFLDLAGECRYSRPRFRSGARSRVSSAYPAHLIPNTGHQALELHPVYSAILAIRPAQRAGGLRPCSPCSLPAGELWRAFLYESCDTFAGVGCAGNIGYGLRLVLHLRLKRLGPADVQQPFGRAQRLRRPGGEL